MTIVKLSPMKELDEMKRDMERLFDEVFDPAHRRPRRWWPKPSETMLVAPNIDMYDRKGEIVIKAELPGIEKENIDLSITKDTVVLKGEIKKEEETKEENYYLCERVSGKFTRTIDIPAEVDAEKVRATFKNGVLEIVLPKKEQVKPTEIKIEAS